MPRWIVPLALALFLAPAAHAAGEVRVALLPIAVHASGSDRDYVSRGLVSMISSRLEQFSGVTVVPPGAEEASPSTAEEAAAAARRASASYALYGSFTRFGEGASLDLRCLEVPKEGGAAASAPRRIFIQSGQMAEIIPQLDPLAEKVARFALGAPAPGRALPRPGEGEGQAELEALRQRVEALERALAPVAAAGKPAVSAPVGEAGPAPGSGPSLR